VAGFFAAIADCCDVQRPVPLERWDLEAWYAPDIPPRRMVSYTRFAAFCPDIDCFEVCAIGEGRHLAVREQKALRAFRPAAQ
jgi:hypothetical protein